MEPRPEQRDKNRRIKNLASFEVRGHGMCPVGGGLEKEGEGQQPACICLAARSTVSLAMPLAACWTSRQLVTSTRRLAGRLAGTGCNAM